MEESFPSISESLRLLADEVDREAEAGDDKTKDEVKKKIRSITDKIRNELLVKRPEVDKLMITFKELLNNLEISEDYRLKTKHERALVSRAWIILAELDSSAHPVEYVGDFVEMKPETLILRKHAGKKSVEIIQKALSKIGLRLGDTLDPRTKQAFLKRRNKPKIVD